MAETLQPSGLTHATLQRGRCVSLLWVAQFLVSNILLLLTSRYGAASLPLWGEPLDVLLAFTSVFTTILLVPLLLIALWLVRAAMDLNVLLPGLAWRTYVFFQALPALHTLLRPEGTT